jgi:glutamate dehydrogenase (NAD(P)+)
VPDDFTFADDLGPAKVIHFIANAGGVICAAMELHGAAQGAAFQAIEERIRANTEAVIEDAKRRGVLHHEAGVDLALRRVRAAMSLKRCSIF